MYAAGIVFPTSKVSLMLFLANENIPAKSIEILRASGFIVKSVKEEKPGITDTMVLDLAKDLSAIILTFDKDYGEIIFRNEYPAPPSVVFFRFKGYSASFAADFLLSLMDMGFFVLDGYFTIVEENNIRQRKL